MAAVAFLTRLPVDRLVSIGPADVARGTPAFPIVGGIIGAAVAATAWTLQGTLPTGVAAVVAVAVELLLTGALHLDGLADTADGYAAANRTRALEIMRDHATGTFGTAAIAVDLLLRTVAIGALIRLDGGLLFVVAAGALSRGAIAVVGSMAPYAREDGGTGGVLRDHATSARATTTAALAIVIATASTGARGAIGSAVAAAVTGAWTLRCVRRLGGMTGDTLGATAEGVEIVTLLVGVAAR